VDLLWLDYLPHLWKIVPHFVLSSVLGYAGYLLTLTICLPYSSQMSMDGRGILRFAYFVGLLCAVSSHLAQDYWLNWF